MSFAQTAPINPEGHDNPIAPVGAPAAPTSVTATAINQSKIDLSWNNSVGATIYNIYRSDTADGTFTKIGNKNTTNTTGSSSYNDTGLPCASTRYYYITAVNRSGESVASQHVSATTLICMVPLDKKWDNTEAKYIKSLDALTKQLNVKFTDKVEKYSTKISPENKQFLLTHRDNIKNEIAAAKAAISIGGSLDGAIANDQDLKDRTNTLKTQVKDFKNKTKNLYTELTLVRKIFAYQNIRTQINSITNTFTTSCASDTRLPELVKKAGDLGDNIDAAQNSVVTSNYTASSGSLKTANTNAKAAAKLIRLIGKACLNTH